MVVLAVEDVDVIKSNEKQSVLGVHYHLPTLLCLGSWEEEEESVSGCY